MSAPKPARGWRLSAGPGLAPVGEAAARSRRPLLVAGVLLVLAVLLTVAAAGPGVLPGDIAIQHAVQRATLPGFDPLARWLNWLGADWLGYTAVALLGVGLLYWRGQPAAFWLLIAASVSRVINVGLKLVIHSPRPTPDLVTVLETNPEFGFPSGHTFGAVMVFGSLALVAPVLFARRGPRHLFQGVCLVLILLMGLARIRVGAHWPSDVLGGLLWGGAVLLLLYSGLLWLEARRAVPLTPDPVS